MVDIAQQLVASAAASPSPKLLDFFRRELQAEEKSGFARLKRVPDSFVLAKLRRYLSLSESDKAGFADCCAHWAHSRYGFVVGAARLDHTRHPYFNLWSGRWHFDPMKHMQSVPLLRSMVQQYKIDRYRGVKSHITKEQFEYASSIRSVKAPELRKRVRAALEPLGYCKTDDLGGNFCRREGREFIVHVDYTGRLAQLRYVISRPEFTEVHPLTQFGLETAFGFGFGDWNFIVEENVDDVFALFPEVVTYSFELPDRIRAAVGQDAAASIGKRSGSPSASKNKKRQIKAKSRAPKRRGAR